MTPAPLIHIGYQKTGSSWLQSHLFSNTEAGLVAPWRIDGDVRDRFILADPFEFDADEVVRYFAPGIQDAAARGLVPVVTNERLAGSPNSGGYDSRAIADRLATVFPTGRVLVVIREQRSMLLSTYKQYVKVGGAAPLRRYLVPPDRGRGRVPLFDLRFFEYDRLIRYYHEVFGRECVLVLPFELLVRDATEFARRIAGFAAAQLPVTLPGEPRNPALSAPAVALKRRANLFLVRDRVNPAAPVDLPSLNDRLTRALRTFDRVLPASWQARADDGLRREAEEIVGDRYRAGNQRTAELTGLGLEELGYEV